MKKINKGSCLLFQGDSITDGGRGEPDDPNHALGHGYVFLIAAKLGTEYPHLKLKIINRGISGNRVVDLYARWKEDTLNHNPDLVSILIGVNDVWQEFNRNSGTSTGCYIRSLDYMLESLKNENEKITIVLNEPFALSVGQLKPIWEDFRPALKEKQDAVKNIAEKYNAVYIPLQEIFDKAIEQDNMEYWLWDGIHPTPQGHALIAHQWFKALA